MNVKHCTKEQLHTMGSGLRVVSNGGGGGGGIFQGGRGEWLASWCCRINGACTRALVIQLMSLLENDVFLSL